MAGVGGVAVLTGPCPTNLWRPVMTQPESSADRSVPLNRRDLLRLGAASAGVPLIALTQTHPAGGAQPTHAEPVAAPVADAPPLEGEDHPEARARTVDNLKTLG